MSLLVPAVVGSIMVVGALTHCVLLHFMYDFNATQINIQYSLSGNLKFMNSN